MMTLMQDLLFALRVLRKNPGFSLISFLTARIGHRRDDRDFQRGVRSPAASASLRKTRSDRPALGGERQRTSDEFCRSQL